LRLAGVVFALYAATLLTPALAQKDQVPRTIADSVGNALQVHERHCATNHATVRPEGKIIACPIAVC
jgi:hypothetical protein